jgi:hypothetical protein
MRIFFEETSLERDTPSFRRSSTKRDASQSDDLTENGRGQTAAR